MGAAPLGWKLSLGVSGLQSYMIGFGCGGWHVGCPANCCTIALFMVKKYVPSAVGQLDGSLVVAVSGQRVSLPVGR